MRSFRQAPASTGISKKQIWRVSHFFVRHQAQIIRILAHNHAHVLSESSVLISELYRYHSESSILLS